MVLKHIKDIKFVSEVKVDETKPKLNKHWKNGDKYLIVNNSKLRLLASREDLEAADDVIESFLRVSSGVFRSSHLFLILQYHLRVWFTRDYNVYIVTPYIDQVCLKMVTKFWLTYPDVQLTVYVRSSSSRDRPDDQRNLVKEFVQSKLPDVKHQEAFSKKFRYVSLPRYFHAKFIAGVNEASREAEVLTTSANLLAVHFYADEHGQLENHDTAIFQKMSSNKFKDCYINVLEQLYRHSSDKERAVTFKQAEGL